MNSRVQRALCALTLIASGYGPVAHAKPIAFAQGTTVMGEYGAGTMKELQVFYAPRYFLSAGAGHLALDSDVRDRKRDITYARANYLIKRWNLEDAQANIFSWGGLGSAKADDEESRFAWTAGGQFDFETRRLYSSLKSDYYASANFTHRIDTAQFGVAPYKHDYATLATWFVIQARRYSGEIHEGVEWALLLRLFKRGAWIEAGPTADGKLQAMFMFNF